MAEKAAKPRATVYRYPLVYGYSLGHEHRSGELKDPSVCPDH